LAQVPKMTTFVDVDRSKTHLSLAGKVSIVGVSSVSGFESCGCSHSKGKIVKRDLPLLFR